MKQIHLCIYCMVPNSMLQLIIYLSRFVNYLGILKFKLHYCLLSLWLIIWNFRLCKCNDCVLLDLSSAIHFIFLVLILLVWLYLHSSHSLIILYFQNHDSFFLNLQFHHFLFLYPNTYP